ncbi:MAG: ParB/RepB/Spo0J family partition protein [Chloroflexi bacterium]|nr:ParB/RepB/Spo0J family partition protein [Chloroflexota bacterium]
MSPRQRRASISLQVVNAAAAAVAPVNDRIVYQLAVDQIQPSPRNPRQHPNSIDELADSLRAHGLMQPVVVRRLGTDYQLIAGHRRLEAAKTLGWTEIAAMVREESDDQAYILTLVENLQREDLTPREEAAALEVLVRERGWSTRQVGEAVKRSPMYVSKRLRVFEDPVLADPVLTNQLTVSTAEELLRASEDKRKQLVEQAIAERWGQSDARQAVAECKVTLQSRPTPPRLASRLRALSDELAAVESGSLSTREKRELRHLAAVLSRLS